MSSNIVLWVTIVVAAVAVAEWLGLGDKIRARVKAMHALFPYPKGWDSRSVKSRTGAGEDGAGGLG